MDRGVCTASLARYCPAVAEGVAAKAKRDVASFSLPVPVIAFDKRVSTTEPWFPLSRGAAAGPSGSGNRGGIETEAHRQKNTPLSAGDGATTFSRLLFSADIELPESRRRGSLGFEESRSWGGSERR